LTNFVPRKSAFKLGEEVDDDGLSHVVPRLGRYALDREPVALARERQVPLVEAPLAELGL